MLGLRVSLLVILGLAFAGPGTALAQSSPSLDIVPVAYDDQHVVVELVLETGDASFRAFGIDLVVLDLEPTPDGGGDQLPFASVDLELEGTLAEEWTALGVSCEGAEESCRLIRVGGFDGGAGIDAGTSGVLCRLEFVGTPVGLGRLAIVVVDQQDDLDGAGIRIESATMDVVPNDVTSFGELKRRIR